MRKEEKFFIVFFHHARCVRDAEMVSFEISRSLIGEPLLSTLHTLLSETSIQCRLTCAIQFRWRRELKVHCQTLMPDFKEASFGGMLPGIGEVVQFTIVDVTAEEEFAKKHKIVNYPTLRFYGPEHRENPRQLDGWRSDTIEKSIQIQEWIKTVRRQT